MKKTLFTVTVLLLVAAFGISAFMVGNYLLDGKKQADRMDELSQVVSEAQTETTTEATTEGTTAETEPKETTEPGMLPGYKDIYEQNNDTVGWIKMEGTKINYPVLQTPDDPNYYLYRDFDKKESKRGGHQQAQRQHYPVRPPHGGRQYVCRPERLHQQGRLG